MDKEMIVFDRYTEKELTGGVINFKVVDKYHAFVRFDSASCYIMGLTVKMHVQFIKIGDEWFVCSTSLQRGYRLTATGDYGFRANNNKFIKYFLSDIKFSKSDVKFRLKETNHELAGNKLYQILYTKPVLQ